MTNTYDATATISIVHIIYFIGAQNKWG